ncbi:MAG: hypothetical protein QOJ79_3247 [Actinomycetota bacterium]|jgi:hypothetical protein|nr:hypothetical protein [Actinomycetota bacterium]
MSRRIRIAAFTAAVLAGICIPATAQAAVHKSTTASLTMISETLNMKPNLPSWCLTEDDYDQRVFSGSLAGSYSTTYRLCDLSADGYTAGGIGLQSTITVTGQLSDLTVTAPDGSVHHAVATGQTTYKGTTSYSYSVCYVPLYFVSSDTGTNPLPGGDWQLTVSGQLSKASWTTNALMTDAPYQQSYCPTSQQNLG